MIKYHHIRRIEMEKPMSHSHKKDWKFLNVKTSQVCSLLIAGKKCLVVETVNFKQITQMQEDGT